QEVFPVRNERGETIGALRSEMLLIEHERQRKRHATFRRAIARARELIVAGRLQGGEKLGRLGVHDGIMVIDAAGRIEYLSEPAGAIVAIQDVTDELQKEQELRIKTAMIQEIHHRVKNNLQTIAALLRLQARRTGNAEVAGQLRESIGRIISIAVVHEFLSHE